MAMEQIEENLHAEQNAAVMDDTPVYRPDIFHVANLHQAKSIILTPEDGLSTDARWETETGHLAESIGSALQLNEQSVVLDYGCGIGRVSKELIARYGCTVIGVDISYSMRQLALTYVLDERFSVTSHWVLNQMLAKGLKFDCCIAIWVLQHCPQVADDIALIKSALKENGLFYVLNNKESAIPSNKGWINDGIDIKGLLEDSFSLRQQAQLPVEACTQFISDNTFIAVLENDKQ